MTSDIANTRALIEREIAGYLESPRHIDDIRRLCLRVAKNAQGAAFGLGFYEGRLYQLERMT
jgi:hypothetical protein